MVQGPTNPPVADRNVEDLPLSGENEAFIHDENKFHVLYSYLQRMIAYSMLRNEGNIMMLLLDGMIQNTMETLLRAAAKETTKNLRPIYGAVKDIII